MTTHKITSLILFILFSLKGYTQTLKLNPEINHVYNYDSEIILEEDSEIAFMVNFNFGLKYLNKGHDFDIVLNHIKGSMSNNSNTRKYFNSNKNNPDNKEFKQLLDNVIGKPLSFKVDKNGFAHKNYSLKIDNSDIEIFLEQLTNKFGSKKVNPLDNVPLKEGFTWDENDSLLIKKNKHVYTTTTFTINEVSNKEVIVRNKGYFIIKNDTIQIGGVSIFDRKTGIQLLTKLMMNFESDTNMYMLVKLEDYDYPELILDYHNLTYKKSYNSWYTKDNEIVYNEIVYPEVTYQPNQDISLPVLIESYKSSLQAQKTNGKFESISVYNIESDSLYPNGSYVKVNGFYINTGTGKKPLKLIPGMWEFDSFSLGYLGEYYQGLYEPIPQGDSISIDMSIYLPVNNKSLEITRKKQKNKGIEAAFSNDAVVISFSKKDYKTLIYSLYKTIRFYDKENKEITASYNFLYDQDIKTEAPYTPDELIDIFNDKVNTTPTEDFKLEFKVKNAQRVTFDTFSNFEKHDISVTKDILH
ncbi:hypothetical protein MQE36_04480 [Zhouia spongiae]|uniref:DUF3857 domain-containing protein n=1 Tax=Zhouia spongiae TaxID=2202721 RepID=A0ABY3YPA2_9FLAO|nr:hypothetical protein [Zhouia spongiae]UNY99604.1 hypothetical protein MQE36_04480 [Zhouia spongiae]